MLCQLPSSLILRSTFSSRRENSRCESAAPSPSAPLPDDIPKRPPWPELLPPLRLEAPDGASGGGAPMWSLSSSHALRLSIHLPLASRSKRELRLVGVWAARDEGRRPADGGSVVSDPTESSITSSVLRFSKAANSVLRFSMALCMLRRRGDMSMTASALPRRPGEVEAPLSLDWSTPELDVTSRGIELLEPPQASGDEMHSRGADLGSASSDVPDTSIG